MAYFAPYIDAAGFHLPSYADILSDLISGYQAIYPQAVYLGTDTAKYQEISIFALKVYDTNLGSQLAYNARSPLTAVGSDLDSILKLNGLARKGASYSSAPEIIQGVPGTTITNGTVTDTQGNIWALPTLVIIPTAGSVIVSAVCETAGAISAETGAISTISGGATAGWISATNPSPALPGQPVETDSQVRGRQAFSVAQPSLTRLQSALATIAQVPGVTRINTGSPTPGSQGSSIENPTGAADVWGNPPHSLSMVVEGGTDLDVATAIFSKRGIGPYMNGTTSVPVTDPTNGEVTTVSFSRPTYVPIYVSMTVHGLTGYTTAVLALIQQAIVSYLNSLQIGETLTYSSLYAVAQSVMPSLLIPQFSVRSLATGTGPMPAGTADISVNYNQVVSGTAANVIITAV